MFTGLVEAIGILRRSEVAEAGRTLYFATALTRDRTRIGDSVAVNGVCLTVTRLAEDGFLADASPETLARSSLGKLRVGQKVNLERALRVGDRLGGHFVAGHIDCTATVHEIGRDGQTLCMNFLLPSGFMKYVAAKGSVAVDGVSLTVNSIENEGFGIRLIPHTISQTTLQFLRSGDLVNIETDMIAKYLERLVENEGTALKNRKIDFDFLAKHGYS